MSFQNLSVQVPKEIVLHYRGAVIQVGGDTEKLLAKGT